MAAVVQRGALDAPIPWCPGWDAEALVRHIGDVHRWAATIVRERRPERLRRDFAPSPSEGLLDWYREGAAALLSALRSASPSETFWYWGPAPNALAFWARRQANETAIHRCDAESSEGAITELPTEEALDGIDEWLGLAPLRCSASAGEGRVLRLSTTDGNGDWTVVVDKKLSVTTRAAKADCVISGSASDLFLWSLNRRSSDGLDIVGDASLVDVWSTSVRF